MMTNDPWLKISRATAAGQFAGIRSDETHPWSFFWAKDNDDSLLLTLRYVEASAPTQPLPRLRGIDVSWTSVGNGSDRLLVLKLTDVANRELFFRLCIDIIETTRSAIDEPQAVSLALQRTWRWHYLLRAGSDRRLTPIEQKGLVGELVVLERYLLPNFSALDSIRAWTGPDGSPKDFEIGQIAIEAKARRGAATQLVEISSEDQLDTDGVDALFLHVVDLATTVEGGGESVQAYADRIAAQLGMVDILAEDLFKEKLLAVGLRPEDDYEDERWVVGVARMFRVDEGFPRLSPSTIPLGVESVSYSIDLAHLSPYEVDATDAVAMIQGCGNGV